MKIIGNRMQKIRQGTTHLIFTELMAFGGFASLLTRSPGSVHMVLTGLDLVWLATLKKYYFCDLASLSKIIFMSERTTAVFFLI